MEKGKKGRGEVVELSVIKPSRDVEGHDHTNDVEDEELLQGRRQRSVNLLWLVAVLLLVDFLQMFAVLQSMALRWPWPQPWLTPMVWLHALNLDVWDTLKLSSPGVYSSVQDGEIDTSLMPLPYWALLVMWAGVVVVLAGLLIGLRLRFTHKLNPKGPYRGALLRWVAVLLGHVLLLPLGTVLGRSFHCAAVSGESVAAIDNSLICFVNGHWGYVVPSMFAVGACILYYPAWLILHVRRETLGVDATRYEPTLQLIEARYALRLDSSYFVQHFPLLAPFRARGAYTYGLLVNLKLLLVVTFAAFHSVILAQAIIVTVFTCAALLTCAILRPFRVSALNVMLCFNLLCLAANSLLGCLVAGYSRTENPSPWLTPAYMSLIMAGLNGMWGLCTLVCWLYLVIVQCGLKRQLWPGLNRDGLATLSSHTRHYLVAILRARAVLGKCERGPALFAPVHELERQIKIINAGCREAEMLGDPIHAPLLDALDDLIHAHTRLSHKSLFAVSVKETIKRTAGEFMELMPSFARRMAQREFDFILVRPEMRRILLKLYVVGMFLGGRRRRREGEVRRRMEPLWPRQPSEQPGPQTDPGYYAEVYPEYEEEEGDQLFRFPPQPVSYTTTDRAARDPDSCLPTVVLDQSMLQEMLEDSDDAGDDALPPGLRSQEEPAGSSAEIPGPLPPPQAVTAPRDEEPGSMLSLRDTEEEGAVPEVTDLDDLEEPHPATREEDPELTDGQREEALDEGGRQRETDREETKETLDEEEGERDIDLQEMEEKMDEGSRGQEIDGEKRKEEEGKTEETSRRAEEVGDKEVEGATSSDQTGRKSGRRKSRERRGDKGRRRKKT